MTALLDIPGIAAVLKVSPNTVYRMARAGEIPSIKVRRAWRFDEAEVLAHLRKPKDLWTQPKHSTSKRRVV